MTIYVDELHYPDKNGRLWCHMWTDGTDEELDAFAKQIGVPKKPHISNGMSGRFYHYDLVKSKRAQALRNGAQFMSLRDWVKQRLGIS